MKLFKKREKTDQDFNKFEYKKSYTRDEILKESARLQDNKESMIEEYTKLSEAYKIEPTEETRQKMINLSEQISNRKVRPKEQKHSGLFKKKEKFEEKYCHTCKHNISLHGKRGRSTGCRKCGCLRTIEEIMNPTDNGHDKQNIIVPDRIIEEIKIEEKDEKT